MRPEMIMRARRPWRGRSATLSLSPPPGGSRSSFREGHPVYAASAPQQQRLVHSDTSPCRDCGAPTAASARSCPRCGILNPVLQWVSFPDGSHLTAREAVGSMGSYSPAPAGAAVAAGRAPAMPAPSAFAAAAPAPGRVRFSGISPRSQGAAPDLLADWAIWCTLVTVLSLLIVGGLIGGLIAGAITYPLRRALPVRPDGRQLPVALSWAMIAGSVIVFFGANVLYGMMLASGAK
jgi:hypothetical protein